MIPLSLHPDRLFSSDPMQRDLSRALYATVKDLPIVSPHGHTDPQWYADNEPFTNASALLITPDHYVFRMLYSQGVKLEDLGDPAPRRRRGRARCAQRSGARFAANYRLFRGTPTRIWLDHAFHEVFGVRERLTPESADRIVRSDQRLPRQARIPSARVVRALQHRSHRDDRVAARPARAPRKASRAAAGKGASLPRTGRIRRRSRVRGLRRQRRRISDELAGEDSQTLARLSRRTSQPPRVLQDHGRDVDRPRASDRADLGSRRRGMRSACWPKALEGSDHAAEAEAFRGQMLTEMARMSLDDGLVMQIHPGSFRNHNPQVHHALRPRQGRRHPDAHRLRPRAQAAARSLRQRARSDPDSFHAGRDGVFARARAAGRALSDSEARSAVVVLTTAPRACCAFASRRPRPPGFYNTVGFNDDTRAFLSIPARHDVARRMDCRFLAPTRGRAQDRGGRGFRARARARLWPGEARVQALVSCSCRCRYDGASEAPVADPCAAGDGSRGASADQRRHGTRRAAASSSSRSATRGRATGRIVRSSSARSYPTESCLSSTRSCAPRGSTSDRPSTGMPCMLAAPATPRSASSGVFRTRQAQPGRAGGPHRADGRC